MQIKLSWEDKDTGEKREPLLNPPIALGRHLSSMPDQINGQRVARMILTDPNSAISRYHTLIDWDGDQLTVINQSINGATINGVLETGRRVLVDGDVLGIGTYQIAVSFVIQTNVVNLPLINSSGASASLTNINVNNPKPPSEAAESTPVRSFPPASFLNADVVPVASLEVYLGRPIEQKDFVSIGAGLGGFVWVDLLRIWGVKREQIAALGLQKSDEPPYLRYMQLCRNSQIPLNERLRSNSDSCPDNIWGWPSYAWREAWHNLAKGRIKDVLKLLWQVFSEPDLIETYTPISGNVFRSIDREAQRIGWAEIYRYGSVRAIRKTDDGRYAIAYSRGQGKYDYLIAKYIHLAIGYPAIRFLPDLQAYKQKTIDTEAFKLVVNAYDPHDHIYEHLNNHGGIVVIRGRGIVASRIIQKIYEIRQQNQHRIQRQEISITLIHLMRSPISQGHRFGQAKRVVKNHQELQPFNWPKACWGGDLREMLEKANPEERQKMLAKWGGTTTADRRDWQQMIEQGLKAGWYQIKFGNVTQVQSNAQQNGTITDIEEYESKAATRLLANFIIDATGLDAEIKVNPVLNDLQTRYNLKVYNFNFQPPPPENKEYNKNNGRLAVANDFEIEGMRNGQGRMYAAGSMTLGGPYAAVDSFLGLQYSAMRSVDSLQAIGAPRIKYLNGWGSLGQWWKWVRNQSP